MMRNTKRTVYQWKKTTLNKFNEVLKEKKEINFLPVGPIIHYSLIRE